MQTINWYPGHMTKAKRMLEDDLRNIDVVVEIVDARAPLACRNPDFESLFKNKIRVMLLNKSDLAPAKSNKAWIGYFASKGISVMELVSVSSAAKKQAAAFIEKAGEPVLKKYRERGISKTLRAMVVGVPNAGKSTFINKLAGVTRAQVGDKPGVTRGKQWVKISPYLELMDTPGLLWGKLDDQVMAKHLAYIGSIRDDVMNIEEIAGLLLCDLDSLCPKELNERYKKLDSVTERDIPEKMLEGVAKSRGFILSGGVYDTERASRIVLDEFRGGKIARVCFESPKGTEDSDAETK